MRYRQYHNIVTTQPSLGLTWYLLASWQYGLRRVCYACLLNIDLRILVSKAESGSKLEPDFILPSKLNIHF